MIQLKSKLSRTTPDNNNVQKMASNQDQQI